MTALLTRMLINAIIQVMLGAAVIIMSADVVPAGMMYTGAILFCAEHMVADFFA